MSDFRELQGKIVTEIRGARAGSDRIEFDCADGSRFAMFHDQDCCEHVELAEVIGDASDVIGVPIIAASERSSRGDTPDGTATWTFYELRTIRGTVTLRWIGESNGYYSESVDFEQVVR